MKQNIASAPAKIWNRKNLPSEIENFEASRKMRTELVDQLPVAAAGFARRHRGILMMSLAALGMAAVAWYLARND